MHRAASSSRARGRRALVWEMVSGATPRGRLCGAAVLAAALAALGPDRLGRGPRLCMISAIIRKPCPACGTTRAAAALLRGDLRRAYRFNPRILPLALVALILLARDLCAVLDGSPSNSRRSSGWWHCS
jgi:hypothetical protein